MSDKQPAIRRRNSWTVGSLVTALFVLVAGSAVGAGTNQSTVTLAWDRSTSDQLTNGITYKVYAGINSTVLTNANAGTNISVTFTNLNAGSWFFYSTASQGGLESLPSNTVFYTIPTNAPAPPGKFAVVYLQNDNVLTVSNWTDLGLFRARIYIP